MLYDRAIEHITQASKLTVESSHAAKEVRICVCCSWYVELLCTCLTASVVGVYLFDVRTSTTGNWMVGLLVQV